MKPIVLSGALRANLIAFTILIGSCAAQAREGSKSTIGGVGYCFKKWATAFVGTRHSTVDYRKGGFVHDVNMSGPILGS